MKGRNGMRDVVDFHVYTLKELSGVTGTGVETLRRWTKDDGSGCVLRKHPRSKPNMTRVSGREWKRFCLEVEKKSRQW